MSCQAKDLGQLRQAVTLAETARTSYPPRVPTVAAAILDLRAAEAYANERKCHRHTRRALDNAFDRFTDSRPRTRRPRLVVLGSTRRRPTRRPATASSNSKTGHAPAITYGPHYGCRATSTRARARCATRCSPPRTSSRRNPTSTRRSRSAIRRTDPDRAGHLRPLRQTRPTSTTSPRTGATQRSAASAKTPGTCSPRSDQRAGDTRTNPNIDTSTCDTHLPCRTRRR